MLKMLSNAYFPAKFRFDTAENEPAKKLQDVEECCPNLLMVRCAASLPHSLVPGQRRPAESHREGARPLGLRLDRRARRTWTKSNVDMTMPRKKKNFEKVHTYYTNTIVET